MVEGEREGGRERERERGEKKGGREGGGRRTGEGRERERERGREKERGRKGEGEGEGERERGGDACKEYLGCVAGGETSLRVRPIRMSQRIRKQVFGRSLGHRVWVHSFESHCRIHLCCLCPEINDIIPG